jgi:hypothetical protein
LETSLLLSGDSPEMLSKAIAAETPVEIQQDLAELMDVNIGDTAAGFLTEHPIV